jgi:hypothetical protein
MLFSKLVAQVAFDRMALQTCDTVMSPLAQATHTDLWRRDPAWQVLEFLAWRIFRSIQSSQVQMTSCTHAGISPSLTNLAGFSGC